MERMGAHFRPGSSGTTSLPTSSRLYDPKEQPTCDLHKNSPAPKKENGIVRKTTLKWKEKTSD